MKKHLKFFLLLAALMVPWAANAQTDSLTTCRGTMTSVSHAPFFVYWTDLIYRTEYLVPADSLEDMSGSSITGMTFHMNNTSFSLANMGPFKVMMSETSAASLNSSVWNTDTLSNLVYSGTLSVSNGVLHVELDEPYTYGGDNLIVSFYVPASGGVYDNASNYWIGCSSSTSVLGASREQVATGPGTNVTGYYLPQCTFSYTTGSTSICRTVRNLAADDVLADEATLSWNTRNGESAWVVYLNGEELETVYDSTYTLTNLSANTSYTFGVRAVCSAGDTSNMASTSIRTPCTLLTSSDLPLVETFDSWTTGQSSPIDQCWSRHNTYSSTSNYPYTYSSTHRGATGNSLYCYTSSTTHNTIVLPAVDDLNGLMLSFWTYTSSSANSRFQVGTMTDPTDASTFTAFYTTPSDPASSTWVENEALVPANTTAHYLAIRTLNSGYVTSYIDDVTLMEAPSCFHASGVSVSGITTDEATLTVDDPTEAGNYTYYLYVNNAVVDSGDFSTDTYTLTNLDANTGYAVSVVTNCSDGTRTAAVSTSFRTTCDVISTLPWTENFDSYGDLYTSYPSRMTQPMVPCWDFLEASSAGYMFLTNNSGNYRYGNSGFSLGFYPGSSNARNFAVLPEFSDDISGLELSCWTRPEGTSSSSGSVDFGYITDLTDTSSFVSMAHYDYSDFNDSYQLVSATFAGAPSGARIAMRHTSAATNYYWFVDDIDVHVAPSCTRPSITLSDLTATGITVNLSDANDVNHYMLWWGSDSTEVTGTSYALTDLTAATTYTLTAVTLCGDGTRTASVSVTFTTPCEAIATLPWSDGFESYSTGAAPSCYTHLTPGTSSVNFLQVYNYTTHTGSNCLRFNYSTPSGNVLALPLFDAEVNTLELSLWLRPESYSNSSCGTFEIGYLTDASSASSFVALSTIAYNDFTSTDYREEVVAFIGAPEGARMALRQKGTTTNWYWHVDDIDVHEAPSCLRPNGVAVSGIGSTEAHVTIADSSYAGNYRIDFVNGSDTLTVTVYDTAYDATGLTASTGYTVYVRTICSDGTLTTAVTTSFRTECDVISTLPWHETFQSFTAESGAGQASSITNLPCWTIHQSYSYYSFIQNSWNHEEGGANAIRIYGGDSYPTYMVLPPFEEDLENLMFSFWSNFDNSTLHMVMGYMTDADQTSTFVPLDTIWAPTEADRNQWVYNEVLFPTGAEGRIAYRFYGSGTSNVRLDDYTVMLAPTCMRPQSVAISDITANGADVTIVDPSNTGSYQYTLTMGSTVVDSGSVSTTTFSLTGLNPSSTYTIGVYSVCSDGSTTMPNYASFTTPCVALTSLPYSCDFETTNGGSYPLPNCWTRGSASTSNPYVIDNASNAHTGNKFLYVYGSGVTAALPPVDNDSIDLATTQLSFWAKSGGTATALQVGVMTDPSNSSTFQLLGSVTVSNSTGHDLFEVVLDGYQPSMGAYVAFRGTASNNVYVDDVTLGPIPSCTRPNVGLADLTDTSATLAISDANDVNNYLLSYNNTTVELTDTTYALTGLSSNTEYTVSVATLCTEGDTTDFVTYTFRTPCALIRMADLPLTEDFQSYAGGTQQIPCWTRHTNYGSYPQTSSVSSQSDDGMAGGIVYYMYHYTTSGAFLVTPPFDTLANLQVSCYSRAVTSGAMLTIGVMTDANDTNTFIPLSTYTTTSDWQYHDIILTPAAIGNARFVAFRSTMPASTTSGGLYIDAIRIGLAPACPRPQDVAVANVVEESGSISATITWSNPGTSTDYRVYYTTGNTTDSVDVSDTTVTLTGLAASTSYTVNIVVLCDEDGNMSDPSSNVSFSTPCIGAISILPYFEDFNGTPGANYDANGQVPPCWDAQSNASSQPLPHVSAAGSYHYSPDNSNSLVMTCGLPGNGWATDAYAILPTFTAPLSDLSMSFWMATENTTGYGTLYVGYMDANDNFTAIDTIPASNTTYNSNGGIYDTVSFASVPAGNYRIAFHWHHASSYYSVCIDNVTVTGNGNTPTYYTVSATSANATMGTASVTPSGSVEEGTNVTATATANDGFQFVNWTVGGNVVSTANPYTFSVTANTTLVANFDTLLVPCDAPTAVTVSNVGLTSATISWTAAEGQDNFEVHVTGTGYDQTFSTSATTYTVTGLATAVEYTVTVRAICSVNNPSPWSAPATFTTNNCQPVTGVSVGNKTTNSVQVSWTAPAGVTNFELEYGASGFASGTGTRVETSTNSATLTGLTAGMAYDVYVRSVCGNGAYSPWSNATPFTTEDDQQGINDVNNANIALFPNPATTTVTLTGIDGQATVTIVDMNGRVNGEWKVESGNLTIDLTGYAQGAYFVRITGEQVNAIRKLIVK